jgi:SPP1 gp7 family putative phage head morphogenesis protein
MAKRITYQSDIGNRETEQKLKELEKKIRDEYTKATKELEAKTKDYLEKFEKKDSIRKDYLAKQYDEYLNGKISFNDYKAMQEEYKQWRIGQVAVGKRWEEMRNTMAEDLTETYSKARGMIEGYMPEVYALNHNYATFQVEKSSLVNTSYSLYDAHTVERLIKENPRLLPNYKFGSVTYERMRQKNLRWNQQRITSAITQGILQGESIPKIAKRMRDAGYMEYKASIRDARTSITSAQNAGRIEAMHRAEDLGIKMMKQWLATIDDRTRHEHRELDGQRVPIDEPFEVEGYEIMYPADPSGDPEMVYNCRCTMIQVFDGYDKKITDFDIDDRLGGMSYEDWKESKESESDPIDKQEREAEAMRRTYNEEYRRMKDYD